MRKLAIAVFAVSLTACASSQADKAAKLEQAWVLADTAWLGYLRLPDCETPEGQAVAPLCSETTVIAKGAAYEQAAFDAVEAFHDGKGTLEAAEKALGDLQSLVSALPHK